MLTLKYLQNLSGTIMLAGFDQAMQRYATNNINRGWFKNTWLNFFVSLTVRDEIKKINALYVQLQKAKAGDTNYKDYIYGCLESYLENNPKDLFSKFLYSEVSSLACKINKTPILIPSKSMELKLG